MRVERMRRVWPVLLTCILSGCASDGAEGPREYLDEQTAATIRVVADPIVLVREGDPRDVLNVYAIDVNRMGHHEQYLAVLQWWGSQRGGQPSGMQLETGGSVIELAAASRDPRDLGLAEPVDKSAPKDARWLYFPIDRQGLATLAKSASVKATLQVESEARRYFIWRDGRDHLAELAASLP